MKNYLGHLLIALAIVGSVWMLSRAYTYKNRTTETINVTGLAEKDFESDLIVWEGSFSREGQDLKTAYASIKEDESMIKKYLSSKGVSEKEIVISAVNMQKLEDPKYDGEGRYVGSSFRGYMLSQSVKVESKDIEKVEKLSREVSELLEGGIAFNSGAPSYYYTKLNELKIDLLAKASADAKLRAETIAKNTGANLSSVKKANMGIFQITAKNGDETFSYGGAFNTSSKQKTASITMKVEYQAN